MTRVALALVLASMLVSRIGAQAPVLTQTITSSATQRRADGLSDTAVVRVTVETRVDTAGGKLVIDIKPVIDSLRIGYPRTSGGGTPPDTARPGILFGHAREPILGPLRTTSVSPVPQDGLTMVLQARAAGTIVFLNLTGGGACTLDAAARFDIARWRVCFDRYALPNLAAITANAAHVIIYLLDEPNHPSRWGEEAITPTMIEEMAAYSKSRFPGIPTVVRAAPDWLRGHGRPFVALDLTWAAYAARRGDVATYRTSMIAGAHAIGLGLVFSLNAIDGGPTDPSDPLFEGFQGSVEGGRQFYAMGPRALKAYGEALVTGGCALLLWQYREVYSTHRDIVPVLDGLARLASQQPTRPCRKGVT